MAVIDFPAAPANGQVFVAPNGVTYRWQSTPAPGLWLSSGGGASISSGDTPPSNPVANQLWFHTTMGQLFVYYDDGNTTQWVPASPNMFVPTSPGGDVTVDDTTAGNGLPINVDSVLPFNTVKVGNTGGWWSTSTYRYTPPAGKYLISCYYAVLLAASASSIFLKLRKNGVSIHAAASQSGSPNFLIGASFAAIVEANGTDYFDVTCNPNANGCLTNGGSFSAFPLSGIKGQPGEPHDYLGGDFFAYGTGGAFPSGADTVLLPPVITGNNGGYYNPVNGRFTPPAGRYHLAGTLSLYATASATNIQIRIRKNGVVVISHIGTCNQSTYSAEVMGDAIVDANGTDYFDLLGYTGAAANLNGTSFSAFPISGIKGPPGDPGAPGPAGEATTVLQTVSYQTGALVNATGFFPQDNTRPQIGEGTQIMTLAITPKSATSKLVISVQALLTCDIVDWATMALFRDTTANALAVATMYVPVGTAGGVLPLQHVVNSTSTALTTFKVRAGASVAGTTTTMNGFVGSQGIFGTGAMQSSIVIQEVA